MIRIQKATLKNLKDLQNLNQKLFDHDSIYDPALKPNWPFTPEGEEYFKKTITNERYLALVAIENDRVIGYLAGYIWNEWSSRPVKTAEVDNMLVIDEYQNQGVGSLLVNEFIKWCQQQQVKSIFVMAYTANTHALSFYKKNGFNDLSVRLEKRL